MYVAGGRGGRGMYGNVSDLGCLVFQNPCQGLASPERQRLAPFPAAPRPPWHTPSDACSRRDLDSLADAWVQQSPSQFFSPSLHLKSYSAIKLKKCSKGQCQNVSAFLSGTHPTVSWQVDTAPGEQLASRARWSFTGPGQGPQLGWWNRCSADSLWVSAFLIVPLFHLPHCTCRWVELSGGTGDFQVKNFSTNLVFEKQSPALQNLRNQVSETEICITMEFE